MVIGVGGTLLLGGATLAGAAITQRLTGLGFALVASPFLVIAAGPHNGVVLANLLSLVTNLVVLATLWREVNVRRALALAVPAVLAVPVGAWVAGLLRPAVLEVSIGVLVLIALLVVTVFRGVRLPDSPTGTVAAGAASGFMNVTAGVGGPAVSLYVLSTRWEHREFVASIQLYFAIVNATSLLVKGVSPGLGMWPLISCCAALAVGAVIGQFLTRHVGTERARQAVLVLAYLGAGAAIVKGALT